MAKRLRTVTIFWLAVLVPTVLSVSLAIPQTTPPPAPSAPPIGAQPEGAAFRPEELDQLLAPVALYPDSLLAHVLMAATYPLEVVQAARWSKDNASLKGDQLTIALRDKPWDPSVKSLVQFREILGMMNERLEWTQKLGDAFLGQQRDVMDSVQRLRKRAQQAGSLQSTPQQTVKVEKETIIIQPSSPTVVYVPTYDPVVVYGAWPYPAYPPYYYYPPGYAAGVAAVSFTAGFVTGAALYGNTNWHHGDITINQNISHYSNVQNVNVQNLQGTPKPTPYQGSQKGGQGQAAQQSRQAQGQPTTWQHNPAHRKGAPYANPSTAQRFGQARPSTTQFGSEARGYGEPRATETARPQSAALGAQGSQGRARGTGDRPQPASLGNQSGARPDGNAFGGVGSGGFDSAASQRGLSSRSGSSGASAPKQGSVGGARRAGGGGRGR